jgi:FixJ family two-component response regulator
VLDVHLPGLDGLALQRRLAEDGPVLPIVFLSGHGDIPMTVRALKAGAVDFLTKPVAAKALLAAVRSGVEQDASARARSADRAQLRQRLASLTPREREVLAGLIAGKLNKQIAGDLGVVEQTVKFHRARIMERMQAHTLAELMHLAASAGVLGDLRTPYISLMPELGSMDIAEPSGLPSGDDPT